MTDAEKITALEKRIADLEYRVNDTSKALGREGDDTTKHIKAIYQYIADIHDYLMPVVYKVFPGYGETKKEIDAFMTGRRRPPEEKKTS